jgi:hypothetical protein
VGKVIASVLSKFISFFYLTPLKTQSTKNRVRGTKVPLRPLLSLIIADYYYHEEMNDNYTLDNMTI